MEDVKKRIAHLLNVDISKLTLIEEENDQYLVITDKFKNYIYSRKDDTVIDIDEINENKKVGEQYLTAEEKNQYYIENEKLIGFVLKKINRLDGIEDSELKDICMFGFAKALNSYNKKAGVKFSTYCVKCMLNEMYYFLRKEQKKLIQNISFDKPLSNDDEKSLTYGDIVSNSKINSAKSIEDQILNNELRSILLKCLDHLEDDEQYLIIYRYGLDQNIIKTQNEIAKTLKMSQANISKLERTCLQKLRIIMKKYKYEYNAKSKTIKHDNTFVFDTGASEKFNYIDKKDRNNIEIITCEKLKIDIDEIQDVIETNDKNEFHVTFKTNKRIYAIVNNITTHVKLMRLPLSRDDSFMSIILDIPFLSYNISREDVLTDKYNITYSEKKLENELNKLSKEEKYIVNHFYGLNGNPPRTMEILSEELGISVYDALEIRKNVLKKLRQSFKS